MVRLKPRWFPRPVVEQLIALRSFSAAAHGFSPDIIQAPEWGATGWWSTRFRRSLLVTRLATPSYLVDQINLSDVPSSSRFTQWLERDQTQRSSAVLSPTTALARLVGKEWELDESKIHVIPNPVGLDAVRRAGLAPCARELPDDFLVFIGRLERRKGIEELAHALGKVLPKHPGTHAILVGRDARESGGDVMRQFWNDVSSVRDRVHVLGELPRDDALRVVARAKLVVLPSRWENFANTALEALALDRPVIATRTGGFVEFIEHDRNGWLVPPGDAEALAAELDRRLGDSDGLLRIGKAAGAHAAEFDAPMIATRLVALYEELLSTQPRVFGPSIYGRGYRRYFHPETPKDPFRRHYADKRTAVLRKLDSAPPMRILDVGGGYGRFAGPLAERHEVVLCDISEEMLGEARKRYPNLATVNADARSLPFGEEAFDAILAIDLFSHLPSIHEPLSELVRVCRKGGRIIFDTTNASPWWVIRFPSYVNRNPRRLLRTMQARGVLPEWRRLIRHYKPDEARAAVAAAGLRIDDVQTFGPPLTPKWHLWWTRKL